MPGTTYVFAGTADGHPTANIVQITHKTKTILNVKTVVVDDTVTVDGKLTENTIDWYAQDKDGNVWYFGEFTTEYKDGVVLGHEGSFEAGVDGAQPGIIMEGNPHVGDSYCQENAPGVAQDQAKVLSLHQSVCVPDVCTNGNVLLTKETSPLQPGTVENKYYVPGVGAAKAVDVKGGQDEVQLVAVLHEHDE